MTIIPFDCRYIVIDLTTNDVICGSYDYLTAKKFEKNLQYQEDNDVFKDFFDSEPSVYTTIDRWGVVEE